ncbi:hypothetical protein GDO78_023275 [Eleutherodactylus coqui]|uniref:Uncharacterized protein n=1 Tax=Eleutherodactylus coqui TaxID=57060 RepID=A0A8J6AZF9_ELECQ|nr:hypothetical protein GDO78_023275 [Eleutherodactylus coqui]
MCHLTSEKSSTDFGQEAATVYFAANKQNKNMRVVRNSVFFLVEQGLPRILYYMTASEGKKKICTYPKPVCLREKPPNMAHVSRYWRVS